MASFNDRMNVELSQTDQQDIETALDLLETKFSFLRALSPEERKAKIRLGVNNMAFMTHAKEAFDDMPELLPRILDPVIFEKEVALLTDLRPFIARISQLSSLMEDTSILLGDHTYRDALEIFYSSKKGTRMGMDGARLWKESLETRFEVHGNRPNTEEEEGDPDIDDAPELDPMDGPPIGIPPVVNP